MGQIIINTMQKNIINFNININKSTNGTWYWKLMVLTHGINVAYLKGGIKPS